MRFKNTRPTTRTKKSVQRESIMRSWWRMQTHSPKLYNWCSKALTSSQQITCTEGLTFIASASYTCDSKHCSYWTRKCCGSWETPTLRTLSESASCGCRSRSMSSRRFFRVSPTQMKSKLSCRVWGTSPTSSSISNWDKRSTQSILTIGSTCWSSIWTVSATLTTPWCASTNF